MTQQNDEDAFEAMSDAELIAVWDTVEDGENLTPYQQAIIDEIERRNLDL